MNKKTKQLFMKIDSFKKSSGHASSKKRTLDFFSKIRIMLISGRVGYGLFFSIIALTNYTACMPDIDKKLLFSMTGETAETTAIITKLETISYGPKGRNDYKVYYTYNVNGKSYSNFARQSGLLYLENRKFLLDYSVKNPSSSCPRDYNNLKCPYDEALYAFIAGTFFLLLGIILLQSGIRRVFNTLSIIEYGSITDAEVKNIESGSLSRYKRGFLLTCSFKDDKGEIYSLEVYSKIANYVKKGETLRILYDPDLPQNALAIEALPDYVKTVPGMI